jgi:hypothetical protein
MRKPDGTWCMTSNYQELNKVLRAAIPSAKDILDQLAAPRTMDLANTFISIDLTPESQDRFPFTYQGHQWTFLVLPQEYLHSPTLCHNLVARDLAT